MVVARPAVMLGSGDGGGGGGAGRKGSGGKHYMYK